MSAPGLANRQGGTFSLPALACLRKAVSSSRALCCYTYMASTKSPAPTSPYNAATTGSVLSPTSTPLHSPTLHCQLSLLLFSFLRYPEPLLAPPHHASALHEQEPLSIVLRPHALTPPQWRGDRGAPTGAPLGALPSISSSSSSAV